MNDIIARVMRKMGLTATEIEQAVSIVCDSNDTKSATKTPAHSKASIDKGPMFVGPEQRLQEILDGRF